MTALHRHMATKDNLKMSGMLTLSSTLQYCLNSWSMGRNAEQSEQHVTHEYPGTALIPHSSGLNVVSVPRCCNAILGLLVHVLSDQNGLHKEQPIIIQKITDFFGMKKGTACSKSTLSLFICSTILFNHARFSSCFNITNFKEIV